MDYGFFDDSYTVAEKGYNGADRMSPQQFLLMGSVFVLIVILSVLLRKKKKEDVFRIYKVLSVLMPIVEISKLAFSTVADLTHGEPFNLGGILPLYTCSMLLYFLPVVAWGKGKLQRYSMAFFVSIGLVAGMSNFVYLSAAGFYPLFTYGCLYSVFFHAVIVFVGMSLMITEIYTPSLKTIREGMVPVLLFSIVVIPANFIIKHVPNNGCSPDYMMLMDANGFIPAISNFFIDHNIQIVFSLIMLFAVYPLVTALITLLDMGIIRVINTFRKNASGKIARHPAPTR
ncbi:MAG: YwaF family protein [Erysipelotrichales bacterium]|nr:YwaF family protein [Erysipelotrichales bacterium]